MKENHTTAGRTGLHNLLPIHVPYLEVDRFFTMRQRHAATRAQDVVQNAPQRLDNLAVYNPAAIGVKRRESAVALQNMSVYMPDPHAKHQALQLWPGITGCLETVFKVHGVLTIDIIEDLELLDLAEVATLENVAQTVVNRYLAARRTAVSLLSVRTNDRNVRFAQGEIVGCAGAKTPMTCADDGADAFDVGRRVARFPDIACSLMIMTGNMPHPISLH